MTPNSPQDRMGAAEHDASLSEVGQNVAGTRMLVSGWDSRHRQGTGVDLLRMSQNLSTEQFRQYLAASRYLRQGVKK